MLVDKNSYMPVYTFHQKQKNVNFRKLSSNVVTKPMENVGKKRTILSLLGSVVAILIKFLFPEDMTRKTIADSSFIAKEEMILKNLISDSSSIPYEQLSQEELNCLVELQKRYNEITD